MKPMHKLNKTTALLRKISTKDISSESSILSDPGLLELFSWHTSRAPKARIKDTLRLLVKDQLISQGSLNNEALFSITPAGKERLTRSDIKSSVTLPDRWSNRWHFVTYQIPAQQKVARNAFILELKRIGFLRYGPALWIFPHDLTPHLKKFAAQESLSDHIEYIRADSITNQKKWQKQFKL